MRFESRSFWLAKDAEYGNACWLATDPEEAKAYQDAFELDAERGVAAIADGVASAIFSRAWARILTRATVADPPNLDDGDGFQAWLAERRDAWSGQIDPDQLTWYQKPKMAWGAASTLLWLELSPAEHDLPGSYRLRSFAIGDCCLFHFRRDELVSSFPLTSAAEFGSNPETIRSIDRKQDHLLQFQVLEDDCWPEDLFVLCTDAVAQWAIRRQEAADPVRWEDYWDVTEEAWREEIGALRRDGCMRYDDATLVLLRVVDERFAPAIPPDSVSEPAAEEPIARDAEAAEATHHVESSLAVDGAAAIWQEESAWTADEGSPAAPDDRPTGVPAIESTPDDEPESVSADDSLAEGEPEPRPTTEPLAGDDAEQ